MEEGATVCDQPETDVAMTSSPGAVHSAVHKINKKLPSARPEITSRARGKEHGMVIQHGISSSHKLIHSCYSSTCRAVSIYTPNSAASLAKTREARSTEVLRTGYTVHVHLAGF